jgi:hypothetical protein
MTLLVKDCKKGMDVLLTDPDPMYDLGYSNPAVGTKTECVGTISHVSSGGIVHVKWSNGASNSYKDGELSTAHDGKFKSLWRELKSELTNKNEDVEENIGDVDFYSNFDDEDDELEIDGDF